MNPTNGGYRWWLAEAGFRGPNLQIQITPLRWGIAIGIGGGNISLTVGPFSIRLFWKVGDWMKIAEKPRRDGDQGGG